MTNFSGLLFYNIFQGVNIMKQIKKKIIAAGAAAVLALLLTSGSDVKGEMAELVKMRTDIMNGFFCGQISYYDALAQIKSVEKGRLLEEDILAMKEYFQTDIEEVNNYKIRDIEITNADENLVCAVVSVDWEVSGIAGKEKITEIYSVIMEKDEKSYKLVQFF